MSKLLTISESEVMEMTNVLKSRLVTEVVSQVQDMLQQLDSATLNIAVTGESGSGKSSFVNTFRSVDSDNPQAALCGVTETTREARAYSHPRIPTVTIWDLLGSAHLPSCQRRTWSSDLEATLRRRRGKGLTEAEVLIQIREDCDKNLRKAGLEEAKVFLLSCFQLHGFDFPLLHSTIAGELEGHKRHVFLLSLPNLSSAVVEQKKTALRGAVWWRAMEACLTAVTTQDGCHGVVPMLMNILLSYQRSFGLDTESLQQLAELTGNSYQVLHECVHSTTGKELSEQKVQNMLSQIATTQQTVASYLEKRVPVLGTIASSSIVFAACYYFLTSALNDLSHDAEKITMVDNTDNCCLDSDLSMITEDEVTTVRVIEEALENESLTSAAGKIQDYLDEIQNVELSIAITGESGSGKSTFINAFRGLGDEDEGSAATGVVQTTIEVKDYPHPKHPNVKLWDLPGVGTPNFKPEDYLQKVQFERYDFFIIISSERFKANDVLLANDIQKMKKKSALCALQDRWSFGFREKEEVFQPG
ncbi:hypothetical protein DPEC_G00052170 [Dallia pectoralis]|uniref:Uncharacterized protein n=1 Tax=Dallia pectoralis TaxID=75939 RepID=A0ACC2HC66_DALPE|nr:hypothetical protein DPEC_G00052170 [Dallia pectoralis]